MNRICILKATKRILEMQGGGKVDRKSIMEWSMDVKNPADRTEEKYQEYLAACAEKEAMRLDTLKQNAIKAGHAESDIEVKWVTDAEYATAKAEDPNEIAVVAAQEAKQAEQAAKAQAFVDNLPSRVQAKTWIDAAFPDVKQNAFMTKLCNVVYWDIKGTAD